MFSNCIADLCPLGFRIYILMIGRILAINMNICFQYLNPSRSRIWSACSAFPPAFDCYSSIIATQKKTKAHIDKHTYSYKHMCAHRDVCI